MKSNPRFQGSGGQKKNGTANPKGGYRLGKWPGDGALRVPDVETPDGSFMHDAEATDSARPVGGITTHGPIKI
jgi:hypothetical protein